MRLLVITSCTGEKAVADDRQLTVEDFRLGAAHVAERERQLADLLTPAEDLYAGQQHTRLMRGVRRFRARPPARDGSVDLWILSAGYGLVPSRRLLAPYEMTFAGMPKAAARSWSQALGIPEAFRRVVEEPYDLGVVLLGDAYLDAVHLDPSLVLGGPTLFVVGASVAPRIEGIPKARAVPVSTEETRRFGCGLVGLKGEIGARLLAHLAEGGPIDPLLDPATDVLALLEALPGPPPKRTVPARTVRPNPAVDVVVRLPASWHAKPHRARLRYFVPDWDDRVDPDFDFGRDAHSGGASDWSNEVYAHQLFPEPNYDGILVSRATVDETRAKRDLVYRLGVHRFLRVPPEFPVLGDCGAFSYVKDEVPPYSTADVLDYYTRLGFDLGVSVDHLVFADTEETRRFRYELTTANAEDFLREHRARGLRWEPVGAVQGWDPATYAEAARRYVAMGYGHLALGGLVRTGDREILRVLRAVHEVVPPGTKVHLLGVARLRALRDFVRLGVTSIDSASFLRRAWLGSDSNYLTPDGWYAAIRIPLASHSFRAKQLVQQRKIDEAELRALEGACLEGLRAHAARRDAPSEGLLDLLMSYEDLLAGRRHPTRERIRRTLEERPWERCGCAVCARLGIEVVIFRGNNRNRRRGFHNTRVFYGLIDRLLEGQHLPWPKRVDGSKEKARQLELVTT